MKELEDLVKHAKTAVDAAYKLGNFKELQDVSEFHKNYDQPIVDMPSLPSLDRIELRISLIKEELRELEEALMEGDLVHAASELVDLNYVLKGTVIELGLQGCWSDLHNAVHEANMGKLFNSESSVQEAKVYYEGLGVKCSYKPTLNGKFLLTSTLGKVLKPLDYKKHNLEPIINESIIVWEIIQKFWSNPPT